MVCATKGLFLLNMKHHTHFTHNIELEIKKNQIIMMPNKMITNATQRMKMEAYYSFHLSLSRLAYWRINWDKKLLLTRRGGKLASS